jgi:hypothetical protein
MVAQEMPKTNLPEIKTNIRKLYIHNLILNISKMLTWHDKEHYRLENEKLSRGNRKGGES